MQRASQKLKQDYKCQTDKSDGEWKGNCTFCFSSEFNNRLADEEPSDQHQHNELDEIRDRIRRPVKKIHQPDVSVFEKRSHYTDVRGRSQEQAMGIIEYPGEVHASDFECSVIFSFQTKN